MPNIMIMGAVPDQSPQDLRDKIDVIIKNLKLETKAITTFLPAVTRHCNNSKSAPYLEVRDEKEETALLVAKALNEELDMEVEVVVIKAFFSRPSLPEE